MTKRLPHGVQAILDMRKIEDYCLNPSHPRGCASVTDPPIEGRLAELS
jgi:hypothetical protein